MEKKNGGQINKKSRMALAPSTTTKSDNYIKKILSENKNLYKFEIPLILKAFKLTVNYFLENLIEFEIKEFFKFTLIHTKESRQYSRYRDEYYIIPAHNNLVFKAFQGIKDYLNSRHKFANAKHREFLPDGLKRTKKIF